MNDWVLQPAGNFTMRLQDGRILFVQKRADSSGLWRAEVFFAGGTKVGDFKTKDRAMRACEKFAGVKRQGVARQAERVGDGRWVVRTLEGVRVAEVFGGRNHYQVQSLRGVLIGAAKSLRKACNLALSSAAR